MHSLHIMHCDVKPENVMVCTSRLHLYLFDMGLARKGHEEEGRLQVECDGCTPAYAGPEVLTLFDKFEEGMPAQEKNAIQKQHPIDATCHDLWASALTIFQAVYTTRDGVWVSGAEGAHVLDTYWKAQTQIAEQGAAV